MGETLKEPVNDLDDDRTRTPARVERLRVNFWERAFEVVENPGFTTAPGIDGLFYIADTEKGPFGISANPLGKPFQHLPLEDRSILEFIEKKMPHLGARAIGPGFQA
ncbi:MAG TPA: hypothetical protein PL064_14670, partial [Thermogutta sp.]|nr:hypothetical protein [Thermogutta sp.]